MYLLIIKFHSSFTLCIIVQFYDLLSNCIKTIQENYFSFDCCLERADTLERIMFSFDCCVERADTLERTESSETPRSCLPLLLSHLVSSSVGCHETSLWRIRGDTNSDNRHASQ